MFTSFLFGVTSEEMYMNFHPKPNMTFSNTVFLYTAMYPVGHDPVPVPLLLSCAQ